MVGLVLIDPTDAESLNSLPGPLRHALLSLTLLPTGIGRALGAIGGVRLTFDMGAVTTPENVSKLPPDVRDEAQAQLLRAQTLKTLYREQFAVAASVPAITRARLSADLPLILVLPGLSKSEATLRSESSSTLELSDRSRLVLSPSDGHYVQLDQPDLIVELVVGLVQQARRTRLPRREAGGDPVRGPSDVTIQLRGPGGAPAAAGNAQKSPGRVARCSHPTCSPHSHSRGCMTSARTFTSP